MTTRNRAAHESMAMAKPLRLSEAVLRHLMTEIVRGDHVVDELLPPEPEICQRLGVSRTVVREALGILASKGLVTVEHGRGTRVNSSRRWQSLDPLLIEIRQQCGMLGGFLDELLEVRRIVEVEVTALAAERATADYLEELGAALAEMAGSGGVTERHMAADLRFHEALALAAGNSLLYSMLLPIHQLLDIGIRSGAMRLDREQGLVTHQAVYDAIAARDPARARDAMQAVVANFERNIRRALQIQTAGDEKNVGSSIVSSARS